MIFPSLLPLGLIRVNEVTGEEIRGENGLCIRCKPGEPGEFVGKIVKNHPVRDFDGYADTNATKKKIVKDVWSQGDMCFRSGDILVMDEFGWLYFKDRAGDTFRWRGENVSTTEVEATVSSMVELKDAIVYGVEIPGAEGKAGMAAIHDPDEEVDVDQLAKGIKAQLPTFAWPLFVRWETQLNPIWFWRIFVLKAYIFQTCEAFGYHRNFQTQEIQLATWRLWPINNFRQNVFLTPKDWYLWDLKHWAFQ